VDFDVYQGRTYVLTDDGVYEIFDEKVSKRTEEGDSLFRISVYDGNLYVADMASNRIWKYVNGDNGFSAPIEWTSQTENEFRNFSDLVDWEIDGSVWVLRENAEVLRLVQGKVNEFGFKDVVPELSEAKSIFADKNLDELFILDSKEKRLVIIDKENGEYIAQYSLDGINNPQGVVVNKDQKKAFILSDGKLYSIDLLHSE
jgi:sugar lactone lactonase YvrE